MKHTKEKFFADVESGKRERIKRYLILAATFFFIIGFLFGFLFYDFLINFANGG